jgi:hypothetical protein
MPIRSKCRRRPLLVTILVAACAGSRPRQGSGQMRTDGDSASPIARDRGRCCRPRGRHAVIVQLDGEPLTTGRRIAEPGRENPRVPRSRRASAAATASHNRLTERLIQARALAGTLCPSSCAMIGVCQSWFVLGVSSMWAVTHPRPAWVSKSRQPTAAPSVLWAGTSPVHPAAPVW